MTLIQCGFIFRRSGGDVCEPALTDESQTTWARRVRLARTKDTPCRGRTRATEYYSVYCRRTRRIVGPTITPRDPFQSDYDITTTDADDASKRANADAVFMGCLCEGMLADRGEPLTMQLVGRLTPPCTMPVRFTVLRGLDSSSTR
jgi:hypothetical protein